MSSRLKINVKSKKLNVTFKNPVENDTLETERDEDFFKNQLQKNYDKGFNEGQKSAKEQLENDYSKKLAESYQFIKEITYKIEQSFAEYEEELDKIIINLSVAVAKKIVKKEILKQSIINDILQEALRKVAGSSKIIVRMNPQDIENISSINRNYLFDESFTRVKFEPDERIELGGCIVETDIGNVDATISSQFNEILKQLEANY